MLTDFLTYERELCSTTLIPLLRSQGVDLAGRSVLDVGCGYGGVLAVLHERYGLSNALGIDVDPDMIRTGRERTPPGVSLAVRNFFGLEGGHFDFILMRDVLEHIVDVERALAVAVQFMKPGSILYASFAPFFSPFGGHQHNGSGFFSWLPWLQFLPEAAFRRLLFLRGNAYKTSRGLEADMDTVLKTRLTIAGFRRLAAKAGFVTRYYAQYLVRPDYRIKFGLPTIGFPRVPLLDEIVCTGVEALLEKR
jgi:SAM-dependent methyltransferase